MPTPIPVILDTDIGTDIDDTWALAQLLRCPELDPKLILTASGDVTFRAAITAKFLEAAGRTDVPIGLGLPGHTPPLVRNQEPWLKNYDFARYPGELVEDGIGRLIRIVEASPQPVTIIAIAPSGNLAPRPRDGQFRPRQHLPRFLVKTRPRRGQLHRVFAAIKQPHAQLLLQVPHLTAQRRLGEMKRLRGAIERAVGRHSDEVAEVTKFHPERRYSY